MKTRANAAYIDETLNGIVNAGPFHGRDDLLPPLRQLNKQARNMKYKRGIASTGRVIAAVLMSLSRYAEAKPYLDECIKMLNLLSARDDLYFVAMLLRSQIEAAEGKHSEALKITTGLLADYKDKMSLERYAGFCLNTGTIYLAQGLLYQALYYYQKIISRRDEFRDITPFNGIWMSYANTLKELQLYNQSLDEFLTIIKEDKLPTDWYRFHVNMDIAGLYALHFHDFDNSKKHMDECFRLADPETQPVLYATALSNQGINLMAFGKYSEALQMLTDERVINLMATFKGDLAKLTVKITTCLLQTGEVKKALKYLQQADDLLKGDGMILQKTEHYDNYFLYHWLTRSYSEAGRYNQLYKQALNESHQVGSQLQAEQVKALLALEKKERELEAEKLQHARAQREVEFARQQNALMQTNIEQRNTLIDEFQKAIKKMESTDVRRKEIFKELHEKISTVRRGNIEMAAYDIKYNTSHHGQVQKLQTLYPAITPGEAKIAVMLASGLGNKEIAGITLTTLRNIETQRMRIRKKMDLKTGVDLLQILRKAVR